MKFKIPCLTSLLSIVLVICGAILSDNLQAMSPAASAARQKVLLNLQARIRGEEYVTQIKSSQFGSILGLTSASGFSLPATVSLTPIVDTNASKPAQGFSLVDLAIQNTIRGASSSTGDSGPAMLFDLLYFGAPAHSWVNHNSTAGEYGPKVTLPFKLSPSTSIGALYFAIQAGGNVSSACAAAAADPILQTIVGNNVNSVWLGASCTSTSGCCGNNVCKNGVCDIGSAPVTTCPTVPCPSGYNCVSGACVKNVPVACTASSCGVGNYCNVATGSCVAGCLSAANCGGTTALCDTTLKTCVAQIQGTDSGCSKAADCALGACNSGTCAKPAGPAACTASSCGVGHYCDVATGSCVAGCLSAANCGGATALCDTTLKTCVAQIQGTDSGCSKAADCALGACNSGTCAKPAGPAACTASSCGVGNYCNVATGSCVAGCLTAANCASGYNCVSGACVCINPKPGNCSIANPCCSVSGYSCDPTYNSCYVPGTSCFSNAGCQSGYTCSVQGGSTPGACQKAITCTPGVSDTPATAAAATPYVCTPKSGESSSTTQCCAGFTCQASPSDQITDDFCQTCGTPANGQQCVGLDFSGNGVDPSCCSGMCSSGSCTAVS